ncbi:hypothetical protein ACFSUM_18365 [Virgibacillus siamensis]
MMKTNMAKFVGERLEKSGEKKSKKRKTVFGASPLPAALKKKESN